MQITSQEIRKKFLDFFKSKNHAIIPSSSVVPENDPSVLFNTAGMQPLVPYLLGEKHPLGKRLANYQKCIRTNDIEDVGDDTHLTFFEMLGNWSLGDYFKKDSIKWSYEFLTSKEWLGIDPRKIAVTVFKGDKDALRDEESANIWRSFGINNISYLGKEDNWWGPAGITGPCGPDTEIFYRIGKEDFPSPGSTVENDKENWMEIWNNVFMEYIKNENGEFIKSKIQNVDTGMGLERITRILTGAQSVYETDIFLDIIEVICKTLKVEYNENTKKSIRIIADHTRTSVIMLSDGVIPSNVDRGYILRRLLRRAIRQGYKLGFKGQFLSFIAQKIIEKFLPIYSNISNNKTIILQEIDKEEKQFLSTLEKGLKEFDKWFNSIITNFGIYQVNNNLEHNKIKEGHKESFGIFGKDVFRLYDTFGFPLEMTLELYKEKSKELGISENNINEIIEVITKQFNEAFKRHQELSRIGAAQKFAGGLADHSEATTALHSATHLMLAGLRKVLGPHVHQAGSNITAERLRFDFTHEEKLTPEQLKEVENYVNQAIEANAKVILEEMKKEDAKAAGVEGSFWEKYPDIVKVYTFKSDDGKIFSCELCGGPHVKSTGGMGKFKIIKEEAVSRGVRRIKAILEK